MATIGVIMSVYNSEKTLELAMNSILNQTFSDWKLYIVDDYSNDNSWAIIQSYMLTDERIYGFRNTSNLGLTKNLNYLLSQSSEEYVARFDSDDINNIRRFEEQLRVFRNESKIDIIGSNSVVINNEGEHVGYRRMPEYDEEIKRYMILLNPLNHPSVMFRRKSLENQRLIYCELFKTSQDWDLWLRAKRAGLNFYNIQHSLLYYRVDNTYHKKKSSRYRLNEVRIRLKNSRGENLVLILIGMCLSIILALMPEQIFKLMKQFDNRNK